MMRGDFRGEEQAPLADWYSHRAATPAGAPIYETISIGAGMRATY